ncbi:MAG: hypothetical protein OEZ34_09430 [Spirochaetia bacterium]|nr:hypothetical protein [Spirochaetia bacterium]
MKKNALKLVLIIFIGFNISSCVKADRSDLSMNSDNGLIAYIFYSMSSLYSGPKYIASLIKSNAPPNTQGGILYSHDGKIWQEGIYEKAPLGAVNVIGDAIFNGSKWVTGGYSTDDFTNIYCRIWNSSDGVSWNLVNCPFNNGFFANIAYGNGFFLAGGYLTSGVTFLSCWILKSYDGINWSIISNTPSSGGGSCKNINFLHFNKSDSRFYLTTTDSGTWVNLGYFSSADGTNWTAVPTPGLPITPNRYEFLPAPSGLLGIVSDGTTDYALSYNNGFWSWAALPGTNNKNLIRAGFNYFALAPNTTNPYYYFSNDISTWTGESSYACSTSYCQFIKMYYRASENLYTAAILKSSVSPYPLEFVYSYNGLDWQTGSILTYFYPDPPSINVMKSIDD